MNIDFQRELLKYLCQSKESRKYITVLEESIFATQEAQIVFSLLKEYVGEYKGVPGRANMLQFFETKLTQSKHKVTADNRKIIEREIKRYYEPLEANADHIKDEIIQNVQYTMAKTMFSENAGRLNEGVSVFKDIRRHMDEILKLEEKLEGNITPPHERFFLASHTHASNRTDEDIFPTYLDQLNRITGIGGFTAPQVIVFMGAPKSFKTGTLINIIMPYVLWGMKVYWVDMENGEKSIRRRMDQYLMECSHDQLKDAGKRAILDKIVGTYRGRGGDINIKKYKNSATCTDIQADLDELRDLYGWVPDIIAIDYADHLQPIDRSIKDKRLKIQEVYFDIKDLNDTNNTLTITLSQVSKAAVGAKVIDMTHFAEDFGKAANCDGAYALCQTKEERKENIVRIIPVVQREGLQYNGGINETCFVRVDHAKQRMYETSYEELMATVNPRTAAAMDMEDE